MNRKLYVGNLPYQTTEQDLEQLFSQAGAVDTVRVMRDQATGRARGFAFVEMASEADAEKAVNQLHDQDYGGRKLTVTYESHGWHPASPERTVTADQIE